MFDLRRCVNEVEMGAHAIAVRDVCATFDTLAPAAGSAGPDLRATDAFVAATAPSPTCQAVVECSRALFDPPHRGP